MSTLTPRAARALRRFGLTARAAELDPPSPAHIPTPPPSTITLITGPSGAGKSLALRAFAQQTSRTTIRADDIRLTAAPAIDHLPGDLDSALRTLATVGLAEARLFARPASALSEGQRERLRLAIALHSARAAPAIIVADEFLARLDEAAARALARATRRAIDRAPTASLLCASASPHYLDAFDPDLVIRIDDDARASPSSRTRTRSPLPLHIAPADLTAYHALARFHYRARAPAAAIHTLAAHSPELPSLNPLGVLVVAMPTLNAFWRALAWPGRYDTPDKRANAARLNAEVRRIARCVVHPSARGLGVASALVRAYLADPLTPRTEAAAAMATASPFLGAAGMREHRAPPSRADARLADALHHARIHPARLTEPDALLASLAPRDGAFLERELRRWAADSRRTARRQRDPLPDLLACAAASLCAQRTAYTHTA